MTKVSEKNMVYYDPKFIEALKNQLQLSPSTAHKIFNPYCIKCLIERGKRVLDKSFGR